MPRISRCFDLETIIWESEKLDLDVIWLDLANTYGAVPQPMIQLASVLWKSS